jgi:RNA polymerase sigma-70 factor (ECF subfamily)
MKTTEFSPVFMYSEQNEHLNGEALEKEENFKKLEQCIETLPEEQKRTVVLFYLENKCYNEIAEMTGFEWNKVRSYIQNGKRNLKICIDGKNGNKS